MTGLPLILITGLLVWQSVNYALVGKLAYAVMMAGWAVADAALIWSAT